MGSEVGQEPSGDEVKIGRIRGTNDDKGMMFCGQAVTDELCIARRNERVFPVGRGGCQEKRKESSGHSLACAQSGSGKVALSFIRWHPPFNFLPPPPSTPIKPTAAHSSSSQPSIIVCTIDVSSATAGSRPASVTDWEGHRDGVSVCGALLSPDTTDRC